MAVKKTIRKAVVRKINKEKKSSRVSPKQLQFSGKCVVKYSHSEVIREQAIKRIKIAKFGLVI